mmetsp:Transcript_14747/g.25186  ORF Transcript_14747/g.25186 Transcript_14747/m.25186 type:complete len:235 (-) Transcript_14747:800-1504(-)
MILVTKEYITHINPVDIIRRNFLSDNTQDCWKHIQGRNHLIRHFSHRYIASLPSNNRRHTNIRLPRRSQPTILAAMHALHLMCSSRIDAPSWILPRRSMLVLGRARRAIRLDIFLQPPSLELTLGAGTAPLGRPGSVVAREDDEGIILDAGILDGVQHLSENPIHLLHGIGKIGGKSTLRAAKVFACPLTFRKSRCAQLVHMRKCHVQKERIRVRGMFLNEVSGRGGISLCQIS